MHLQLTGHLPHTCAWSNNKLNERGTPNPEPTYYLKPTLLKGMTRASNARQRYKVLVLGSLLVLRMCTLDGEY
jgi:hypothetical protein